MSLNIHTAIIHTPIGQAKITGNTLGIQSVKILEIPEATSINIAPSLEPCVLQLHEYFAGERIHFELLLNPQGTDFQKKVWKSLLNIPFGKTKNYLEQSKILGNPKAIRAVAAANGKNPIWILIPCHRIIGSNGELTGYAGGLWRKKWLLAHESKNKQQRLF